MLIYCVTLFFLNLRGLEGDNEALMDACSYSRLPPYIFEKSTLSIFDQPRGGPVSAGFFAF